MTEITLNKDEHIEYLSRDLGLIVSKEHTFGTDALLLADFASPKRYDICCDFGTGCGIIPMLWCRDGCGKEISAVEIQEKACSQLTRSVKANDLQDKLFVYNADLKEAPRIFPCGKFDVITMNPPYKAENAGIKSQKENEKIARHETLCNLRDITKAASKLLKFGGKLCICIRPERLFETMEAMNESAAPCCSFTRKGSVAVPCRGQTRRKNRPNGQKQSFYIQEQGRFVRRNDKNFR